MYSMMLSDAEVETLAWLANRGYFPSEIYDKMHLADGEPEEPISRQQERKWVFPEHVAWSLIDLRENDPDAYLSCLSGELLEKVLKLESSIV